MNFNISHSPPTEQVLHNARTRLSRQLHKVRMFMVALYVTGAFSFPLGVLAAILLTGNEVAHIPGQLVLISTLAVIGGVVYLLLRNMAEAEEMERKLDDLRPVVDDCCGLSKLSEEFPIVDEYRAAVAAQQRQMVFGEFLVIKDWFESKHGNHPGHISPSQ
jgi:hypothetical protein